MFRSFHNSQNRQKTTTKKSGYWSGRIKRSKVKKAVHSLKEETFLHLYLKFQYSVHESQESRSFFKGRNILKFIFKISIFSS